MEKKIRPEKLAMVREITDVLKSADYVFLSDYRGLTVEKLTELRNGFGDGSVRVMVVRNAFLKLVMQELGIESQDIFFDGPTALIAGKGDVTVGAKVVVNYGKENEFLVVKGGVIDGVAVCSGEVVELSKIPSREVLLSRVVGTIAAPMSQFVGVMNQKLSSLLYVLKAVEEKKAKAG